MVPLLMINKAICCQCVLWLKSKIAKISTLKVKRIAKSLKFDPVNNSSLKVLGAATLSPLPHPVPKVQRLGGHGKRREVTAPKTPTSYRRDDPHSRSEDYVRSKTTLKVYS